MWPCSLGALLVREGERATEKEWRRARGEARGGGGHTSHFRVKKIFRPRLRPGALAGRLGSLKQPA